MHVANIFGPICFFSVDFLAFESNISIKQLISRNMFFWEGWGIFFSSQKYLFEFHVFVSHGSLEITDACILRLKLKISEAFHFWVCIPNDV